MSKNEEKVKKFTNEWNIAFSNLMDEFEKTLIKNFEYRTILALLAKEYGEEPSLSKETIDWWEERIESGDKFELITRLNLPNKSAPILIFYNDIKIEDENEDSNN